MAEDGKPTWKLAKELMKRDDGCHVKPKTIAAMMENGKLSVNNKEHVGFFNLHFDKFLNAKSSNRTLAAEYTRQRECYHDLDRDIEWIEFTQAISVLKNDKALELNGVPPNVLKCMDERNL